MSACSAFVPGNSPVAGAAAAVVGIAAVLDVVVLVAVVIVSAVVVVVVAAVVVVVTAVVEGEGAVPALVAMAPVWMPRACAGVGGMGWVCCCCFGCQSFRYHIKSS